MWRRGVKVTGKIWRSYRGRGGTVGKGVGEPKGGERVCLIKFGTRKVLVEKKFPFFPS
jgi:hypothetical protein